MNIHKMNDECNTKWITNIANNKWRIWHKMNDEYSTKWMTNIKHNEWWVQHKMNDEYGTKWMMNIKKMIYVYKTKWMLPAWHLCSCTSHCDLVTCDYVRQLLYCVQRLAEVPAVQAMTRRRIFTSLHRCTLWTEV